MPKAGEGGRSRKKAAKKSGKAGVKKPVRKAASKKPKKATTQPGKAGTRSATKKKAGRQKTSSTRDPEPTPCLDSLDADEAQEVLTALLREAPALRAKAERLARDLISPEEGNFEDLADSVAFELESLDPDMINFRSGHSSMGYIDPSEAAWELLEEAIEPFHEDLRRRRRLGSAEGALEDLKGILVGLYRLSRTSCGTTDTVLGYAEDWPLEEAGRMLETWAMAAPELLTEEGAARGGRHKKEPFPIDPAFVREHMPAWAEAFERRR